MAPLSKGAELMADFLRYLAAWLDGCGWGHDEFMEGYEMGYAQANDQHKIDAQRREPS